MKLKLKQCTFLINALWLALGLASLVAYLEIFGYDDGYGSDKNMKHVFTTIAFINLCLSVALFFIVEYTSVVCLRFHLATQLFVLIIFSCFFTIASIFKGLTYAWCLLPTGIGFIFWFMALTVLLPSVQRQARNKKEETTARVTRKLREQEEGISLRIPD